MTRHIPEDVKLAIRQKCGFGCIFCGMPFFQYDHLIDFAEGGDHSLENINLLCPNHHALKTTGVLSRSAVEKKSKCPFNKGQSWTGRVPLELHGQSLTIRVGCASFEQDFTREQSSFGAIIIGSKTLLGMRCVGGWLSFDMSIVDIFGKPLIEVDNGEFSASTKIYDFNKIGSRFSITSTDMLSKIEMTINQNEVVINKGIFLHKNTFVSVDHNNAEIGTYCFYPPMKYPIYHVKSKFQSIRSKNNGAGIVLF